MTRQETIELLTHYNKWRRGNDDSIDMPDPKKIGEAIDYAINHLIDCG